MPNSSRKKPENQYAELHAQFSKVEQNMHRLEEKLAAVETDKENLRAINKKLIAKLKDAIDDDKSLQVFFVNQELEKQQELWMLAAQKLLTKSNRSYVLQDHFAKLLHKNSEKEISKSAVTIDSGIDILEGLKKQLEEENELLKKRNENLLQNEKNLKKELEKSKEDNRELVEKELAKSVSDQETIASLRGIIEEQEKKNAFQQLQMGEIKEETKTLNKNLEQMIQNEERSEKEIKILKKKIKELVDREKYYAAKTFSDEIMIQSLQEIMEEQEQATKNELDKLQIKLKFTEEKIDSQSNQFYETKERALSAEAKIKEQQKDNEDMEQALTKSDDRFEEMSSKIEEVTNDMSEWKSKAELVEAECNSKDNKISKLEMENKALEKESSEISERRRDEIRTHMVHIVSMNFDITSLQKAKEDLLNDVLTLENKNQNLTTKMQTLIEEGEMEKGKMSKLQDEVHDLEGKNMELHDIVDNLNQQIHKFRQRRGWKRLVTCS